MTAASKHIAVRDAVAALYAVATALAGGRIKKNRDLPLEQDSASQIHVYCVESPPARNLLGATAPIDWTTTIRTLVKARTDSGLTAEAVADDIMCNCYARVMADQTLGGRVQLLDPGPLNWDQDEADTTVFTVSWDIQAVHRTEFNAIT